jgi:hypothetical protein
VKKFKNRINMAKLTVNDDCKNFRISLVWFGHLLKERDMQKPIKEKDTV